MTQPAASQSPAVEPIPSMRDRATVPNPVARPASLKLTVGAGDGWLDSGVAVVAGETVGIQATGSLLLADGRVAGPAGIERGWKDLLRLFPLNGAPAAALLGRVSGDPAARPFALPSTGEATMPTSGHLYLRANLADDLVGSGTFAVELRFPKAAVRGAQSAASSAAQAVASAQVHAAAVGALPAAVALPGEAAGSTLARRLSPALFATLPRRIADRQGTPGDMVNFALVGTEAEVKAAFNSAGWVAVDRTVEDAILHGLLATLGREAYTAMPMSTLYLFGRPQDLSFAQGDPLKVAAERHHLRVWKTTETVAGQTLWVGSATHDIGFERDGRNGDVTHRIDPAVDDERDYLLHSFDAAGVFSGAAYVLPADPLRSGQTATGGDFHSDGRIAVMQLAGGATSPAASR